MKIDTLKNDEFILSNLILERKTLFCQILKNANIVLNKKRLKQPHFVYKRGAVKEFKRSQDFLIINLSQIKEVLNFCKENPTRNDKFAKNYKKPKITRIELCESVLKNALGILENKKDKFRKDFSIFLKNA